MSCHCSTVSAVLGTWEWDAWVAGGGGALCAAKWLEDGMTPGTGRTMSGVWGIISMRFVTTSGDLWRRARVREEWRIGTAPP